MKEKKSGKNKESKKTGKKAGRQKKQLKKQSDGSVFLTVLCIVLCCAGVVVFKDYFARSELPADCQQQTDDGNAIPGSKDKDTETGRQFPPNQPADDRRKEGAPTEKKQIETAGTEVRSEPFPVSDREKKPNRTKPVLCFVIDDVGNNLSDLEQFLRVPGKVTFAVLPGLPSSTEAAGRVKAAGQELLMHQPMEAFSGINPGPGLLTEAMNPEERLQCLEENLKSVPGAVGVNNHMGSKGTSSPELSEWLLETLRRKNLFFLDSRTIAQSQMRPIAEKLNWEILERNSMFLDNEKDAEALAAAIEAGKKTAMEKGHAVMIGHAATTELADLMMTYYPSLTEEGFLIENLSYLINESRKKNESIGH